MKAWFLSMILAIGGSGMVAAQDRQSNTPDRRVTGAEAAELLEKGEVFFLDVREPKEIEELGTLDGYVNIPISQLEKRLHELPRDKAIITA